MRYTVFNRVCFPRFSPVKMREKRKRYFCIMKFWQLKAPKTLEHTEAPELKLEEGKVKVKITKAMLSESDASVFAGEQSVRFPLVPGRFAIGQVTEEQEDSFIHKNDRVYLTDVTEDELSERGIQIAGVTADGNFRDFTLADENSAYVLPASVTDEAAFLIDAVALAEHVVDEANIGVGQHVLVIGGGLYGNILCQILIYHRAVPIFADNNPERLERAKKSGIYYTFHNDDTLKDNVLKITGGKLADAAVYLAFSNKSEPSSIFSLVARNSIVCFASRAKEPINVNLSNALWNNLTVKGITESNDFVSTAINILANKAVNYSEFPFFTHREEELPEKLDEFCKSPTARAALSEEIHLFKFVL